MKAAASIVLICAYALSGCATFSRLAQTQDTVSKFDQGVHLVSVSEMAFLHQIQAAECTRDFYAQAYAFATARRNPKTRSYPQVALNLEPHCVPKELTNGELKLRQKLINVLTLYADSLEALTNRQNNGGLDSKSSTLAKGFQSLASQQQFDAVSANATAGLNAAMVEVVEFIIDRREYTNIRQVASKLQKPLETIIDALKSENVNDAQGLASKLETVTNEFRIAAVSSRDKRGPASFFDITEAHAALMAIMITRPNVARLNEALDAVVAANKALGNPKSVGAIPEIAAFVRRGQETAALFRSSK